MDSTTSELRLYFKKEQLQVVKVIYLYGEVSFFFVQTFVFAARIQTVSTKDNSAS